MDLPASKPYYSLRPFPHVSRGCGAGEFVLGYGKSRFREVDADGVYFRASSDESVLAEMGERVSSYHCRIILLELENLHADVPIRPLKSILHQALSCFPELIIETFPERW